MDKFGHKWGWADSKWNKIFCPKTFKTIYKKFIAVNFNT